MSKLKFQIIGIVCLLAARIVAADHLQPVDGRIQNWNSVWKHLVSHIPPSPGVMMTAIFVDPPAGQSWMVYVKGNINEHCTVHAIQLDSSWLDMPLEKVKVTVNSKKIEPKIAKIIQQRITKLLLQTRYSTIPMELGSMDVSMITVAAYHEETLKSLMGTELITNIPELSWLMDIAIKLRHYTNEELSSEEFENLVTDFLKD